MSENNVSKKLIFEQEEPDTTAPVFSGFDPVYKILATL